MAVGGLQACSLVVDADGFTEGDGGIGVDRDGEVPGASSLVELLEAEEDLIAQWCACHGEAQHGSVGECEDALTFGRADYASCLRDAYADIATEEVANALECQVQAAQQSLTCKQEATCEDPGAQHQCFVDRQSAIYLPSCMPATEAYNAYFNAQVPCAASHRVGVPSGCPSPTSPQQGSTFLAETPGAGNDFDFGNQECFSNPGAADVAFWWMPQTAGPAVVDTIGSPFDTVLYLADDCAAATASEATPDACNVDLSPTVFQSRLEIEDVPISLGEPLLVVVDGFSPADMGAVRVNLTTLGCLDDPPPGDDILGAIPTGVAAPLAGELDSDHASRFDPATCAQGTEWEDQPDSVLAWRAPMGGTYRFALQPEDPATFDHEHVLYVRRSCDVEADEPIEDACQVGAFENDEPTTVEVSLMAEEIILLVVSVADGGSLPSGTVGYTVEIQQGS